MRWRWSRRGASASSCSKSADAALDRRVADRVHADLQPGRVRGAHAREDLVLAPASAMPRSPGRSANGSRMRAVQLPKVPSAKILKPPTRRPAAGSCSGEVRAATAASTLRPIRIA